MTVTLARWWATMRRLGVHDQVRQLHLSLTPATRAWSSTSCHGRLSARTAMTSVRYTASVLGVVRRQLAQRGAQRADVEGVDARA